MSTQTPAKKGVIAQKLHSSLVNLAADLDAGRDMTEERRAALSNLFAQVEHINALETQMPVAGAEA